MPVPLKVRKDDETVPTREMLLRSQMIVMVTKLLEMYRFDMYQEVNGQDANRQKLCCGSCQKNTFLAKREC